MTDRSLRLAHVTTAHRPRDNRIFQKECRALALAGFDVHLVAVADHDTVVEGVRIRALPRRNNRLARMLLGPLDAWRALADINPMMIQVHDPELIPMAVFWRLRHGRPAVYDAHEDLPKQVMGKPYVPRRARRAVAAFAALLERSADLGLSAIVAATPAIARNYRSAPVTLVQNFPWLSQFPEPRSRGRTGVTRFAYVGGISPERGSREMVDVIESSSGSLELVLAGPVTATSEADVGDRRSGRVSYLGNLPVEQVPGVVSDSDAGFVLFRPLPNHLECQPTKLFEYMAAGRVFVASNFPAWRALLEKYDCGLFVDPESLESIAAAAHIIHTQPDRAADMGARGRAALVENFTFEKEAQALVDMTAGLLSSEELWASVSGSPSAERSNE